MSTYRRFLGSGIVLGLAAGALWAAGRRYAEVSVPQLIDWTKVRQAAAATLREGNPEQIWSRSEMGRRYGVWVAESERLISDYTGRSLPRALDDVRVLDRFEWVDANVANFQILFEPIEKLYSGLVNEKPFGIHLVGGLNQVFLSGQMGLLLGYMAQRVLGQYDMALLGREPLVSGRLYFVEPNIDAVEKKLRLPADEFRMWIALHETTHAYEFEAHPWLRDYMNNMLTSYFETLSEDLLGLKAQRSPLRSIISRVGQNLANRRFALEMVMTGEQRRIFRQLQALMCLVEGFSNHVMDAVGRGRLPGYDTMKKRFEGRASQKSRADRLLTKITGLDVKMEQYRAGEAFVNAAVDMRGIDFVNRVWDSPLNLPTLHEIYHPHDWVARMERAAA